MEINSNTLYYTLSSIPQVLAAITAVLTAFMFLRIEKISKLLMGDAKTLLKRRGTIKYGHLLTNPVIWRLEDGINRENIPEIKKAYNLMCENEIKENLKNNTSNKIFQLVYINKFRPTEILYQRLKTLTIIVLSLSIFTAVISIILLSLLDRLICSNNLDLYFFGIVILFAICMAFSVVLVVFSFTKPTEYEDLPEN